MRLLDLYSGAGGAATGYYRAGFTDILGIDNRPMPRYPFAFQQADALEFLADVKPGDFDLIHASPPCQRYCAMRRTRWADREHCDLVELTRSLLEKLRTPYVIENVPGAPLIDPVLLCGTMFGLRTVDGAQLRRHRLFESPWLITLTPQCQHNAAVYAYGVYGGGQHPLRRLSIERRRTTIGVWGSAGGQSRRDGIVHYGTDARREAMGIDWMTGAELSQSIPPAYCEFIGRVLARELLTPAAGS